MQEKRLNLEKLLAEGKIIQVKPQGYSMYPLFVPGRDEAVIEPFKNQKLRRGDVVLYRRQGGILVLHRIWKCTQESCYMVGDNQKTVEGPLRKEQIRGILIGVIRNGKGFSTDHLLYRICAGIWLLLRPVRPNISRVIAKCKKNYRKKQINKSSD